MQELTKDDLDLAKKKANDKIDFLGHLLVYVLVNAGLAFLNLFQYFTTDSNSLWFLWVSFFWGIGLLSHFITAYVGGDFLEGLRASYYNREIEKIKRNK